MTVLSIRRLALAFLACLSTCIPHELLCASDPGEPSPPHVAVDGKWVTMTLTNPAIPATHALAGISWIDDTQAPMTLTLRGAATATLSLYPIVYKSANTWDIKQPCDAITITGGASFTLSSTLVCLDDVTRSPYRLLLIKAATDTTTFYYAAYGIQPATLTPSAPISFISLHEIDGQRDITRHWALATQSVTSASHTIYVNIGSMIRVHFDVRQLLQAPGSFFTEGRLSLAASLNDTPIEVEPYSEVGKERSAVGATGLPPYRFLLNTKEFQADLYEAAQSYNPALDLESIEMWYGRIKTLRTMLDAFLKDTSTSMAFYKALDASPILVEELNAQLVSALDQVDKSLAAGGPGSTSFATAKEKQKAVIGQLVETTVRSNVDIKPLMDKFELIEREYDDNLRLGLVASPTVTAKLAADMTATQHGILTRISKTNDALWSLIQGYWTEDIEAYMSAVQRASTVIIELNGIVNRSLIEEKKGAFGALGSAFKARRATSREENEFPLELPKGAQLPVYTLNADPPDVAANRSALRKAIDEYWAAPPIGMDKASEYDSRYEQAYHEIYTNLVDGQIHIVRSHAKEGDLIELQLLIFQGNQKEPVALTVARFTVGNYGWQTTIADSFLLIKRKTEPMGNTVSPANFKAAPGVSLLWRNAKRPYESNWWSDNASWGLNVSFIDFDASKDIEVGAGPVLGLFRDRVHIGVGVNLNVNGGWQERSYGFVGFSFAKLAEHFKPGKESSESP